MKNDILFKDGKSLKMVIYVINEATKALNDKTRTIKESAIPDVLLGIIGAGVGASIGGASSFVLLYNLGNAGLSAVGITSGLAATGAIIGGGMVAGIFVLAAPIAVLTATGVGITNHLNNKKFIQKKEELYKEALKNHEAIIQTLKVETDMNQERLDYLQSLNLLLTESIKDLRSDLYEKNESYFELSKYKNKKSKTN